MLPDEAEETKAISIEVDRSKITLGDLRFITKMTGKDNTGKTRTMTPDGIEKMLDMLERVVIGGIEDVPYDALSSVMEAVGAALNPETEIKN